MFECVFCSSISLNDSDLQDCQNNCIQYNQLDFKYITKNVFVVIEQGYLKGYIKLHPVVNCVCKSGISCSTSIPDAIFGETFLEVDSDDLECTGNVSEKVKNNKTNLELYALYITPCTIEHIKNKAKNFIQQSIQKEEQKNYDKLIKYLEKKSIKEEEAINMLRWYNV